MLSINIPPLRGYLSKNCIVLPLLTPGMRGEMLIVNSILKAFKNPGGVTYKRRKLRKMEPVP